MTYGLDPKQVLMCISRPANIAIGLQSSAADVLTIGTSLTESELKAVDQLDKSDLPGPAYGVCQMERATHDDLHLNYLRHNILLREKVLSLAVGFYPDVPHFRFPDVTQLWWNFAYSFAMCRVHYRRDPKALPRWDDARGMAKYWKRVYNTHLGKGTVEKALPHFEFAIDLVRAA